MFYYYGRKKQIAGRYPRPLYGTIIEPFAGAASYALHERNWRSRVILVEKDPDVAALWRWLIHEATEAEILAMPDLKVGEKTTLFLHFMHLASKRAFSFRSVTVTPILEMNWNTNKPKIAANLHKVRHWEIIEGDYTVAPDIEATWFIDPPYQGDAGTGYRWGSDKIGYPALGRWVQSRKGEVIVCEQPGADWLPFKPFRTQGSVGGRAVEEVMYYDSPSPEETILDLFGEGS